MRASFCSADGWSTRDNRPDCSSRAAASSQLGPLSLSCVQCVTAASSHQCESFGIATLCGPVDMNLLRLASSSQVMSVQNAKPLVLRVLTLKQPEVVRACRCDLRECTTNGRRCFIERSRSRVTETSILDVTYLPDRS
jgi:hypothetical protein